MPYRLRGNCVIKSDTGETVKCHETHEQALAHMRALYANVKDAKMKETDHSGFLVSGKDGDHLPTRKNGKLDHGLMGAAWAALHGGYRGNKYEGPNKSEAISKLTALYKSEGMSTPGEEKAKTKGIDPYSALSQFKQADGKWRWVLTTSSGFSDRDGETIPTALLAQDSIRMKATGDYGPLRWQHVGSESADPKTRDPGKGLDIGLCDFSEMHGHTQVESGTYFHEAIGDAFQKQLKTLGGSKGYFYASMDPDANGIYRKPIWGFERSILPRESASNWMATALKHLLHKEADVNETAVKALKDKLGPDNAHLVDELLKGIEQKEETLMQAGVGVKEVKAETEVEVEATGAKAKKEHPDEEKGEMMMEAPQDEKDEEKKKTKEAEVSAPALPATAELVAAVSDAIALKMKDAFITPAMLDAKFAELTASRTKEVDETKSTLKTLSDRLAVLEGETPESKKGLKASSSATTVVDHPLMRAALEQLANSQGLTEALGLKETPQDDFTRLAKRMTASLPTSGNNG